MKYALCLIQDLGVRHYVGPILSTIPARPLRPEEVPLAQFGPQIAELVARAIGWEYLKTLIPPKSVGVEVGVDMGDGAARWLETNPSKLHLVDPWVRSDLDTWYTSEQEVMDSRFTVVTERFMFEPRVEIHRATSHDFFQTLPDNSVDWVYIDGDHSTEGAYSDLVDSYRVVKPGGIIAGDDMHGCQQWAARVRVAYERFCSEHTGEIEIVWDQYAPFIIRKVA